MTEVHSCSYYCDRPECIKAQRDELRERLAQPEQEPLQFKCTVIDDAHPNGVPLEQWVRPPQRKKLPPQTPCLLTQAENKMFRLGWLECEAAHGIKGGA